MKCGDCLNRSGNMTARSQITSDILKLLQYSEYFEDSCKIILEKLTIFSDVDVAVITVFDEDDSSATQYEWSHGMTKLSTVDVDIHEWQAQYPMISERLFNFGTVYCDKLGSTAKCAEELKIYGFPASFFYAVRNDDRTRAFLGIFSFDTERIWDNEVIALLCDMAQVMSVLIYNKEAREKLSQSNRIFQTVLDNIDSFVFVTDIYNDEIIFANQKFIDNFGGAVVGTQARHILDYTSKCTVSGELSENHLHEASTFDFYCTATNQWFDITEICIRWNDERIVRLTTLNDISDKVEYERVIEKQAFFDHLTGLPNRRRLEQDFNTFSDQSRLAGRDSYLLFFDLDNFKNINDSLGHQYGDVLLMQISDYLKSLNSYGAVAYRFGGDEFLVILPHFAAVDIDTFIALMLAKFRTEWLLNDMLYFCTISMGSVAFPHDAVSLNELLRYVDMAVYQVKKSGKDGCFKYNKTIGDSVSRRIELERNLHNDIANDFRNFRVFYQPIINAETRQLEGCEALMRWTCDNLGSIPPSEFIPMAESLGYINQLGDFVLRTATAQCKKWYDMGRSIRMNINLSIGQLVEVDFLERLTDIMKNSGVPYENIVLEVTESLAINDMKKMSELLRRINNLGIKIALDDFGTGYSSLNCLKEMPLSTVKIDKSFIDDIADNPSTAVFVKTIINLSHDLSMRVCAEGVEYDSQYQVLRSLDTDVIQGYLFGKPISAEEFEIQFDFSGQPA